MKLYNQTQIPDKILRKITVAAAQRLRLESKDLIVSVKRARASHISGSGFAHRYRVIDLPELTGRHVKDAGKVIYCSYGWISINIGRVNACTGSAWSVANRFYEVALHELGHLRDYRDGKRFDDKKSPSGRRPKWKARGIEISAENAIYDAEQSPRSRKAKDGIEELREWLHAEWRWALEVSGNKFRAMLDDHRKAAKPSPPPPSGLLMAGGKVLGKVTEIKIIKSKEEKDDRSRD